MVYFLVLNPIAIEAIYVLLLRGAACVTAYYAGQLIFGVTDKIGKEWYFPPETGVFDSSSA